MEYGQTQAVEQYIGHLSAQAGAPVEIGRVASANQRAQQIIQRLCQDFGALENIVNKLLGQEPQPVPPSEQARADRVHVSELQQLDETLHMLSQQADWIERIVKRAHSL